MKKTNKRKILIDKALTYYRQYPDVFTENVLEIKLNLYQKALMRAFFKSKYSLWVLSRGLGKSWLGALILVVFCLLYSNTLAGIIAPSFRQSKIIIQDKIIKDLMDRSPFLRSEVKKVCVNLAEASVEFYNGSRIKALPTGDGNKIRGERFHIIMADEYPHIKKEIIDLVVNPMMVVKQGYEVGKQNYDNSIGNRLLVTSSAYYRHNHLFQLFKQYLDEIANGNNKYFTAILPWQIGVRVGLFDSDHIEKEKKRLSKDDFNMEYGCYFPNISENAWISPDDLDKCSVLKHIETFGLDNYEYVMSIDVARVEGGDNTIVHIFKLVPRKSYLEKQLIYTLSMNGEKFEEQARQIRNLLKKFPNVIRIFMDTQTIGQGLADELSKEYWDLEELKSYPPLIDVNDEKAVKNIKNGIPIIFGITPSAENNHKMGMAVKKNTQKHYLKMYSIDAGDDIIENNKELTEEEEKIVLEAEATRREVMNIEAKPQGMYLKFEPKDSTARKDRWSALGLGLYGIELIEEERNFDSDNVCVGKVSSI